MNSPPATARAVLALAATLCGIGLREQAGGVHVRSKNTIHKRRSRHQRERCGTGDYGLVPMECVDSHDPTPFPVVPEV